jgi:hypothetical protein
MRIRILFFTLMRIRILFFTLMRIRSRILLVTLMRVWIRILASKERLKTLNSNRLIFHTFWRIICKLMWIWIRIQLITLMRIRILPFNLIRDPYPQHYHSPSLSQFMFSYPIKVFFSFQLDKTEDSELHVRKIQRKKRQSTFLCSRPGDKCFIMFLHFCVFIYHIIVLWVLTGIALLWGGGGISPLFSSLKLNKCFKYFFMHESVPLCTLQFAVDL